MCLDGFLTGWLVFFTSSPLASVTLGLVVKECNNIDFSRDVYDFQVKVFVILVRRFDLVKEYKSISFSMDVDEGLAKVMILVRRSDYCGEGMQKY